MLLVQFILHNCTTYRLYVMQCLLQEDLNRHRVYMAVMVVVATVVVMVLLAPPVTHTIHSGRCGEDAEVLYIFYTKKNMYTL